MPRNQNVLEGCTCIRRRRRRRCHRHRRHPHPNINIDSVAPEIVVLQFSVCNFMQLWHIPTQPQPSPGNSPPFSDFNFPPQLLFRVSANCLQLHTIYNLEKFTFIYSALNNNRARNHNNISTRPPTSLYWHGYCSLTIIIKINSYLGHVYSQMTPAESESKL